MFNPSYWVRHVSPTFPHVVLMYMDWYRLVLLVYVHNMYIVFTRM